MKTDEYYMGLAIKEAEKSGESLPCGAVIINSSGEILAKSCNSARKIHDSSAHAEVNALRLAGQIIGNKELRECIIYCTCEPCVMCLAAIAYAKIKRIVFGLNLRDVSPKEKIIDISLEDFLKAAPYKIEITKNLLEKECHKLI